MQQNTTPTESAGRLESLAGDMARQPRRLITAVLIIAVVAAGAFALIRMRGDSAAEESDRVSEAFVAAMGKTDATERSNALSDVWASVRNTAQEPYVLLSLARAESEAGDAAKDSAQKIAMFEKALAHTADYKARYSGNLVAQFPWRPSLQPTNPALPLPSRLQEYCTQQLAWLKAHPATFSDTPDEGLSAQMTLVDPDGKKHSLEFRFFSTEAPHAVDNFLALVRDGYFQSALVYAQERETLDSTAPRGVYFGSAMAKVSPDQPALWGGSSEDVGFTLPKESNRLKPSKGRLMMEKFFDAGAFVGISPVGFLLATSDLERTDDRVVFGEVVGAPEVLGLLAGALAKKEPQEHVDNCAMHVLEKPWTIETVTVSGAPKVKPEVAVLRAFSLPKKPEKK